MIFDGVLMFRHLKTTPFYKDTCDLCFVCYLKPDDKFKFETTPCSNEATRNSPAPSYDSRAIDAIKRSGREGYYLKSFDPKRTE
ncbi:hypothetical protein M3Y98_00299700 [Aphelenchoides besseyi]|nr:hypothetical protein M3Y98_00299700 [Aphelenchoides besseyi]KAI6201216.1 hypothetical protein M3Y96_00818100 [Aphelenchoides besseyi]